MHVGSKRRRADPPARETPDGASGDLAARVSELESRAARVTEVERKLKKLKRKLKDSRSLLGHKVDELMHKEEELAAAKATIAAYAKMHPTFDANDDIASVVLSHVTDVRTRLEEREAAREPLLERLAADATDVFNAHVLSRLDGGDLAMLAL
eukprot:26398-Pelagococcus_subviridis.AAC.2